MFSIKNSVQAFQNHSDDFLNDSSMEAEWALLPKRQARLSDKETEVSAPCLQQKKVLFHMKPL